MQIITKFTVNAPESIAWQILGDEFGEVSDWSEPVTSSYLDRPVGKGAVRSCELKAIPPFPAGKVTEELLEFDREEKALTYAVREGTPPIIDSLKNRWTIEAMSDAQCQVVSTLTVHLKWWAWPLTPIVKSKIGESIRPIFDQFKAAVERRYQAESKAPGPRPAAVRAVA